MKIHNFTDLELVNIEKIENKFGHDYIMTNKHNMRYQCPFCESIRHKSDKDYKFVVDAKTTMYYCFKCKTKGVLISSTTSYAERTLPFLLDYYNVDENENDLNRITASLIELNNTIKIEKNSIAYQYLQKRGVTDEHIEFYHILNGINDNLGRIILPNVVVSNWCDYYQGRSYLDMKPKYLNPENTEKTNYVFNLHNQTKGQKRIYIVEGIFSSILAGKDVVCIYGSDPSDIQVELLCKYNFEEYICCLDGDSAGQLGNAKLAEKLKQKDKNVSIVKLPDEEDPGDMKELRFKEYVEKYKRKYYCKQIDLILGYYD